MSAQTHELTLNISEELLKRLEEAAKRQNLALSELVGLALEQYVEEESEDTPDEEIFEGLRESLIDLREGRTHPARQALDAIRKELESDADQS